MGQTPAPWRVFDAPATTGVAPPGEAASPSATGGRSLPGTAIAALVAAGAVGILAVAIAAGGSGAVVIGPEASLASSPGEPGREVVVDVAGAVARPGLYRLPAGSRVGDAIAAAGGFSPRVAVDLVGLTINLAEVLGDGAQVVVPSRDAAPTVGAVEHPSAGEGMVDLNRATQAELEALPGIGPVTAGKIMASRSETPFRAVVELRERGLVGEATFEKIRSLVVVR